MFSKRISPASMITIVATLGLIALVVLVSLVASRTITTTVSTQFRDQEVQLIRTLSRQTEFFFEVLGSDLNSLALKLEHAPDVEDTETILLDYIAHMAELRHDIVNSAVLFSAMGEPLYGWPESVSLRIQEGQPLHWVLSSLTAQTLANADGVRFRPLPARDQGVFVMSVPVIGQEANPELLVVELDLASWFEESLGFIELRERGQLWVIDEYGRLLYQGSNTAIDWADISELPIPLLLNAQGAELWEYEATDGRRQAAVAPVSSHNADFVLILTRPVTDAHAGVQEHLTRLSLLTVFLFVVAIGLGGVLFWQFTRVERRRQIESQRRQLVATLLRLSRAINSSLDLNEVLDRILGGLGGLLPHDSASIFLLEDDKLCVAAHSGSNSQLRVGASFSLSDTRGASEIVHSGQPGLITDCLNDPRWHHTGNSPIRSWLGVPLRVGGETVGVLNINSHVPFSFQKRDIKIAQAFADQASVAISNARLHQVRIQHYEDDLAHARDIQTGMLPHDDLNLPQFEVVGRSLPAQVVSGDFYQFLTRLDGRYGVALGDITGKGLPAALLVAILSTALRQAIDRHDTLQSLFEHLNTNLLNRMQSQHMNAALAMAVFDPSTRRAEIINAGMIQPYLRWPDGRWEQVAVGGYPLGAAATSRYSSRSLEMHPGTLAVFVSDGVIEARNRDGEFYGFERLEALLAALPPDLNGEAVIDRILAAVHDYQDGEEAQDDISVVVMRSLEAVAESVSVEPVVVAEN